MTHLFFKLCRIQSVIEPSLSICPHKKIIFNLPKKQLPRYALFSPATIFFIVVDWGPRY